MRLDHAALRVKDRVKTAEFYINAFGYKIQQEFPINFKDGSTAKCIALEPPERVTGMPWSCEFSMDGKVQEYHTPPEIFISDGSPDSVVGRWVANRNGVGGLHHMAYQVDSVDEKMEEWRKKGWAEFATENVIKCTGLDQVFSRPSELTGIIYEFIKRDKFGFCQESVESLMNSTAKFK